VVRKSADSYAAAVYLRVAARFGAGAGNVQAGDTHGQRGGGRLRGTHMEPRRAVRNHPLRGDDGAAVKPRPTAVPMDRRVLLQYGATDLPEAFHRRGGEVSGHQGSHRAGQSGVRWRILADGPDVDGTPRPFGRPSRLSIRLGGLGRARDSRGAPIGDPGVPNGS